MRSYDCFKRSDGNPKNFETSVLKLVYLNVDSFPVVWWKEATVEHSSTHIGQDFIFNLFQTFPPADLLFLH